MRSTKSVRHAVVLALFLAAGATHAQSSVASVTTITIEPQSLSSALQSFSEQSGLQVGYESQLAEGIQTLGTRGAKSPAEALGALLNGTRLEYRFINSQTVVIRERAGRQTVGATAGPRMLRLAQADISNSAAAAPATAPQVSPQPSARAEASAGDLEEIVVVGSSLKISVQEVESGALPIQLISQQEIESSGTRTIGEFLRNEPAFSGAPSGMGDGSVRTTLNLRGLGSQYTLTLINGRRVGINGPANVGAIPMEAVERIEVLKAGASAVYGSDAVAGVVNIVLKTSADGLGVATRYGQSSGGYDEKEYSVHLGGRGEDSSYFALMNYRESSGLRATKRAVTRSNDKRPLGGLDDRSSYNLPAPIILPDESEVIINTDIVPVGSTSMNPADFRPYDFERDGHDRPLFGNYALSPSKNISFVFSGETRLNDSTKVSADVLLDRSEVRYIGGATTFDVEVPAENYYNPFGVDVVARYRGLDNGRGSLFDSTLDSLNGSLRLEHTLTDRLTLNVGASLTQESQEQMSENNYSRRGVLEAIARTDATALNPFGNRANSAEQLQGVLLTAYDLFDANMYEFDARVGGSLFSLPAGDVGVAFGVASRNERVHSKPDALFRIGDIYDSSTQSEYILTREVTSVFGEVRIPLLESLELGIAGRYEDYSDFGDTFDPLVSLKWSLSPSLGFRASYNTSFRAPYLNDLIPNEDQSDITVIDPLTGVRTEVVAISGGNPDLKPENAKTFSAGVLFTPEAVDGLFMSLDYYRIDQQDVIIAPDAQAVINGDIPGEVIREENIGRGGEDILIIAQLTNVAKRKLSGLDFQTRYDMDLEGGSTLSFNLATSYLLTFEADVLDGRGFVSAADRFSYLFASLPRIRATSGVTWKLAPFEAGLDVNFVSNYDDPPIEGVDRPVSQVDSVTTVDLSLSMDLGEFIPGLRRSAISVGVENVTDELPPFILAWNDYDRGQHDIRGRFFYVSLNAGF
ncbi:TonB-dependent receptor [Steroidobacter sp.]|uniref:TonB-dependent receptor n=1 Tax=Steroidobacter sp. TaxID=1978227 RepID=UPI001A5A6C63|nr:TonB-dependent receptor [Steroidobacter sp.]MBL8271701.1 TonB-dependent receptor [Steroidobacter sp.]